jgi:osmotically-inducible protein OsmY
MATRRFALTLVIALAGIAGLAAVSVGQETTAATSQDAAAALEQKVAAMLANKLGPDAATIRVVVEKGSKVMLIGTTTRRSTQELAKEVALFVPGVEKVKNKVEFVPTAPSEGNVAEQAVATTGDEASDSGLETSVKYQLKREIGKTAWKIEVEAVEGVVSLRGTVPDQARYDTALKTATAVKGVKQVVDLLRIEE